MAVASHNVTSTIKNRLRTPRLVIIEFVLDSLWDIGSAGQMLFLSLAPNYVGSNRKNIHHECIRFNFKNGKAIENQPVSVLKRLRKLQKYLTPLCSILVTKSSPHSPPEIPLITLSLSSTPIQTTRLVIYSSPPKMTRQGRLWPPQSTR